MSFAHLIRPEVHRLAAYFPGKSTEEICRDYHLAGLAELGTNENAWGPSPAAVAAVAEEMARAGHNYPDAGSTKLKLALARRLGVSEESLVVANGADNLLLLCALACLNPGEEAVMADLTFPVYRKVAGLVGGRPVLVPLKNYAHDLEALAGAVTDRTKLLFLCNPNNPTGAALPGPAQEAFIQALPAHVAVILDEVYLDFTAPAQLPDTWSLIRAGRPVISIRSFSKLYGLAGLRIGYALADPELIVALTKVKEPFAVNRLAQAAALAALGDEAHRERTVRLTLAGRDCLIAGFRALGLACPDSQTNFVMVDLGREAGPVCEGLLRRGLLVRNLAVWGAPTCLRVTVGTAEQNLRIVQALAEILG